MGSRILVDTSIVIDLFRNVPQAISELARHPDRAISIVTWMEIMSGLREGEQQFIEFFEAEFPVVQFSPAMAEEAVQIRKSTRLKLPDAMILATAHHENRVLLTRNSRDFKPGPFVRIPYGL